EYAGEFVPAFQNDPARRDHRESALAARELRHLGDLEERHLAGAAEYGEHGTVRKMVDGVVAPFAGSDHAAIDAQDLVEFPAVEGDRHFEMAPTGVLERDQYCGIFPTL